MTQHQHSAGEERDKRPREKDQNLSPVLTDYLIGLSRQNNNNEEKNGKLDRKDSSDVIKLFRPINF